VNAVDVAVGADTWVPVHLQPPLPMASIALPVAALVPPNPSPSLTTLGVVFETPLRLKHQNHVSGCPHFGVLVDRLAARVLRLLSLYHGHEWAVNLKDYAAGAHTVALAHDDLAHVDVRRRSSRQGTTMDLPGVVGMAWYTGAIHPYLPLLRVGEFTHVGKNTSAGFGRIRLLMPPGDAPTAEPWHTSSTKPPR
jgi:CRISPR/Cas system endoribonuclease Cas6 (RAMP superfamily)